LALASGILLAFLLSCRLLSAADTGQPAARATHPPDVTSSAIAAGRVSPLPGGDAPRRTLLPPTIAVTSQALAPSVTPLVTGRVFYVAGGDPQASDENDGASPEYRGGKSGPWRTIRHASAVLEAGDTVYLRGGVYDEAGIRFAHSGEPDAPIVLAAYPGEQAIMDGSQTQNRSSGIEIANGSGHYIFQGLVIRAMPRSGIATMSDTGQFYRDITIRDCVLYGNGLSGIRLMAVDGFRVENVEAYENAFYGLEIGASDNGALSPANGLVANSSFHDHVGEEGHGMAINQGHDIRVSRSQAYHNRIHGFDVSDWPKRGDLSYQITFEDNFSFDNGVAGFSINSDSHHVTYRRNIAWRNGADWAGHGASSGFLCYEGCWHVEYAHNVSVGNTDAGFWFTDQFGSYSQPGDSLLIFRNNITYDNGRPGSSQAGLALVVEGDPWAVQFDNNDWGGAPGLDNLVVAIHVVGEQGELYTVQVIHDGDLGAGTLSEDPQFVDLAGGDFHLRAASPLVNAGMDLGLPFCGAAPEMGAYEICQ
jgi:hypothetical protein